jgi:hypothetical protein
LSHVPGLIDHVTNARLMCICHEPNEPDERHEQDEADAHEPDERHEPDEPDGGPSVGPGSDVGWQVAPTCSWT